MKSTTTLKFMKVAACFVLSVGLSASAFASCGDALSTMAAGGTVVLNQSHISGSIQSSEGTPSKTSILGLWHIGFVANGQTIQEAFQIWNAGGTEVHNPNVDPRGGNVCLGAWKRGPHRTYTLAHRVWNYDGNGTFLGTIHLSESVTVSPDGNSQSGSFALDFYDPAGNFQFEVPGTVTGERISVD
ncbi:MAG: hypothetical protein HY010_05820 [Acidobacteria bacterium]|nr:hypothetical protein [Acidobacteriota bacterium]